MDVDQQTFGSLLRRYRVMAGLTQERLAERAGLSLRGVSDLERGLRRLPYADTMERLIAALGLGPAERDALFAARRPLPPGAPVDPAALPPRLPLPAQLTGFNGREAGHSHNLPLIRTSLIGREADLVRVRELLLGSVGRLVTLIGTGGCGKTLLALHLAGQLVSDFGDGVWLVNLGSIEDPSLVPQAVAAAVGCRERPGELLLRTLVAHLERRELLLVLDNCEHLLDACASLVEHLLVTCSEVRALATSRERLRIASEIAWRVPSLAAPDPDAALDLAAVSAYPAVRLFIERAQSVDRTFVVRPEDALTLPRICARLEGLPLAIELAAANVALRSLPQLLERLEDSFRVLVGGNRTAPDRQQTMRATMDWSHALLSRREQTVLRRLAVFAGGWSLEAAEAVCARDAFETSELLAALSHLVDASLVVSGEQDGRSRYRLLEPVRQYAREILSDSGELRAVQRAHANFFLTFAEKWHLDRREGGRHRLTATRALAGERDNLRAALRWCIDSHEVEIALRLVAVYSGYWIGLTEERGRLNEVLAMDGGDPTSQARALALARSAGLARTQGDLERAVEEYLAVLPIARRNGNTFLIHSCLNGLGVIAVWRGQYAQAEAHLEESLAVARSAGLRPTEAIVLGYLAWLACEQGSYASARDRALQALSRARPLIGDAWPIAIALTHLGSALMQLGERAVARVHLAEALTFRQQMGEPWGTAQTLVALGRLAIAEGQLDEARRVLTESLRLCRDIDDMVGVVDSLEAIASLVAASGNPEQAARLQDAAAAERHRIGAPLSPMGRELRDAWRSGPPSAGNAMSVQDACDLALAPSTLDEVNPRPRRTPGLLTARQQEVAALIAEGLTNREIAVSLVITERAAAAHIEHILGRLRLRSRTQIAVWATEHGLRSSATA